MSDLIGTYTGTISLFWAVATMVILALVGYWIGHVSGHGAGYAKGLIDGRTAQRNEMAGWK